MSSPWTSHVELHWKWSEISSIHYGSYYTTAEDKAWAFIWVKFWAVLCSMHVPSGALFPLGLMIFAILSTSLWAITPLFTCLSAKLLLGPESNLASTKDPLLSSLVPSCEPPSPLCLLEDFRRWLWRQGSCFCTALEMVTLDTEDSYRPHI